VKPTDLVPTRTYSISNSGGGVITGKFIRREKRICYFEVDKFKGQHGNDDAGNIHVSDYDVIRKVTEI